MEMIEDIYVVTVASVCAFLRTKLNMSIVSEMRVNIADCPALFIMVGVLSEAYTCLSYQSQVIRNNRT